MKGGELVGYGQHVFLDDYFFLVWSEGRSMLLEYVCGNFLCFFPLFNLNDECFLSPASFWLTYFCWLKRC